MINFENNDAWQRLLTFLYECDESISDTDVESDLKESGIELAPALQRLSLIIEQYRARAELANAKVKRTLLTEKLRGIIAPRVDNIRDRIQEVIDQRFSGTQQAAYFHKLKDAATEQDLQTLLDDLERLSQLNENREQ